MELRRQQWTCVLNLSMLLGLVLVSIAISLYLFTSMASQLDGVRGIALLVGLGLLLLVPAKLVLTVLLMSREHDK